MKKKYQFLIIVALILFALPAFAQTIKWRLLSVWPAHSAITQSERRFAKNVFELSGGRLQITTHPAGEIVPPQAVFGTVSRGAAEMGIDFPGYWAGKNSAFDLLGTVPMALSQYDFINWYIHGGGRQLYNEMYGKYNMRYFVTGVAAIGSGIRSRTPVRSLADLSGKKVRISGRPAAYVMQKVGATPVMTPPAEIAQALATGQVDAAAFNTPQIDLSVGLAEVTKYNIGPGWNIPYASGGLMINIDAWNTLPPDLKKIIEVAANENLMIMSSLAEWDTITALKAFEEKGTVVSKLSAKELAQIEEWVWEFIEAEAAKNPDYAKIVTSMFQYMKDFRAARDYAVPYGQGRNPTKLPRLPGLK